MISSSYNHKITQELWSILPVKSPDLITMRDFDIQNPTKIPKDQHEIPEESHEDSREKLPWLMILLVELQFLVPSKSSENDHDIPVSYKGRLLTCWLLVCAPAPGTSSTPAPCTATPASVARCRCWRP